MQSHLHDQVIGLFSDLEICSASQISDPYHENTRLVSVLLYGSLCY